MRSFSRGLPDRGADGRSVGTGRMWVGLMSAEKMMGGPGVPKATARHRYHRSEEPVEGKVRR